MKHKILIVFLSLSLIGTAAAQEKARDGKMEALSEPDTEFLEADVQAKLVYAINVFFCYPMAYIGSTAYWGGYIKRSDYDTQRCYVKYYAHKTGNIRFHVNWIGPMHYSSTSIWYSVKKNTYYSWYKEMINLTTAWSAGKYECIIKIETDYPTVGHNCYRSFGFWLR